MCVEQHESSDVVDRDVLETLIENRMTWLFEEHSSISPLPARFRMRPDTTTHGRRLSQFISDVFLFLFIYL